MNPKPSLRRNAVANFIGSVLPMAVSLVTVPSYLEHIGAARYGVLAIVWMLQGYFGYFDMGLSAATSNRIAQLANGTAAERESVLWTALALNVPFGIVGAALLFGLGRLLLGPFHIAPGMHAEVVAALPWIACSVPLATISGVFTGALSGREQFAALSSVQFVGMLLFQLAPLATAILLKPDLEYVICATIAGSALALLIKIVVVFRVFPLTLRAAPDWRCARRLCTYGASVTVTNFSNPLFESADRLLIGSILGPQAVAYYQVPFNLAVRVRILPGVINTTLFPRLSSLGVADAAVLASRTLYRLAAVLTPLIVFGIFAMHPFMTLWTGAEFASKAVSVGEATLVGVWFSSLAYLLNGHLHAVGRPAAVARLQVLEILPFIALLWWALHTIGLVGAALAWSARLAVDMALLYRLTGFGAALARRLVVPGALVVVAFVVTLLVPWHSAAYLALATALTGATTAWALRAEPAVRARVAGMLVSMLDYGWRRP